MNRPIRARWVPAALCVLALLVSNACGGGGGGDAGDVSTEITDPTAEDQNGAGQGEGGGGEQVRRVSFVPPGPQDDNTPRGNQWYVFLTEGQCKALLDDAGRANRNDPPVILYRAAAEACTGQHAEAAQDLSRYLALGIQTGPEDCGRDFVVAFVRNVLAAVRADPDANITFVKAGRRPPCVDDDDNQGGGQGGGQDTGGDSTTTTARRSTTTTTEDSTS